MQKGKNSREESNKREIRVDDKKRLTLVIIFVLSTLNTVTDGKKTPCVGHELLDDMHGYHKLSYVH